MTDQEYAENEAILHALEAERCDAEAQVFYDEDRLSRSECWVKDVSTRIKAVKQVLRGSE